MEIVKRECVYKNLGGDRKKKMKTKNKILAVGEIAIVLCSMFLVALPAIAATQTMQTITTASEDDFVLGIYGNANEDDTIDMRDLTYVKLIFFGKKPETELADAKYDGKLNPLDFIQIKLIIVGKEKELTIVDSADRIVTVNKPIERLVVTWRGQLEMVRSLKLEKDRIAGVESLMQADDYKIYFAEHQDRPSVGMCWWPDGEAILSLNPDAVFLITSPGYAPPALEVVADAVESAGIPVIRVYGGLEYGGEYGESVVEEVKKFGYIFSKQAEAKEFLDFYEGCQNLIKEKVERIPEEDKTKVYYETRRYATYEERGVQIARAGGKSIFEGLTGDVDPEAVVTRKPDIIIIVRKFGGVGTDDTAECKEIREELMSRPELQNVRAVKTGRVYVLSNYLTGSYGQSGLRSFIQDAYLAKWFHPDLFEDLDPKAIHQEYITRFQGLDIDLDEKGVFVYHPEEHPDGH